MNRSKFISFVFTLLLVLPSICFAQNTEDRPQIALLLFSRGFEFMVALDQGAQQAAEELGVDLTVLDGQSDSQVQLRQIEDLLVRGIDAIIVSPNNSEEIVPGVRRANEAGVPVVAVDAIVGEGAEVVTYVGFNNAAGAEVAADYITETIGSGTVLELQGALGAYHARERNRGFSEGTSSASDIEVLSRPAEWTAENAQAITADTVTANPELNAIFSHNDEMIRGVLAALRQTGRFVAPDEPGHIYIVGIDGTPLALDRIRSGEQDATVNQDPFLMGRLAVESAVAALNGEEVEPQQLLPPTLVTQENVDDPELWGNRFEP